MLGKMMRLPPCRRTNDNMGADGDTTGFENKEAAACDAVNGACDAVGASMSSSSDCRLQSLSLPMTVEVELEQVTSEGGSTPEEGGGTSLEEMFKFL